jgi:hypothetical protein
MAICLLAAAVCAAKLDGELNAPVSCPGQHDLNGGGAWRQPDRANRSVAASSLTIFAHVDRLHLSGRFEVEYRKLFEKK